MTNRYHSVSGCYNVNNLNFVPKKCSIETLKIIISGNFDDKNSILIFLMCCIKKRNTSELNFFDNIKFLLQNLF